jgi:hypothetical protein
VTEYEEIINIWDVKLYNIVESQQRVGGIRGVLLHGSGIYRS